jgi:hypothetical protein
VNRAKGEAEAQRLIGSTLTPTLLRKQGIDKWDGRLPLIAGDRSPKLELELEDLLEAQPSP